MKAAWPEPSPSQKRHQFSYVSRDCGTLDYEQWIQQHFDYHNKEHEY